jgi:hypothetical protein
MNGFLVRVRRRLRLAWALATAQWALPALAVSAVILLLVARVRPWPWPTLAAAVTLLAGLLVVVIAAVFVRIPNLVTARAVDVGLGTKDALATALELSTSTEPQPFLGAIQRRAESLISGRKPAEAVPLQWSPKRLAFSGVLIAGAVALLVVPNHQDAVRRAKAQERVELAKTADEIRKQAAEVAALPSGAAAATTLQKLAEELSKTNSLERGQQAIDKALAELQAGVPPSFLADKAAAVGLERSLQTAPLPGTEGSASEQMKAAAQELAGLSAADQAALAERLKSLAAAQATGSPETAKALEAAATALASGDTAKAAGDLDKAAAAAKERSDKVAAAQAKLAAAGKAGEGKARLGAAAKGSGSGSAAGSGQGQGSGSGQGQGSGQGAGQGSGAAGSGTGSAGAKGPGGNNGQAGAAKPNGSGNNPSVGIQQGDLPIFEPGKTEQINVDGNAADGPGEVVGKTTGANTAGGASVPLSKALPTYQAQATEAVNNLTIAPSERELVKAYFEGLGKP